MSKDKQTQQKQKNKPQKRPSPQPKETPTVESTEMEAVPTTHFNEMPEQTNTRPWRQSTLLHLQQQQGNQFVGRLLNENREAAAEPAAAVELRSPLRVSRVDGLLTDSEETDAIGYTGARYDTRSVMIIQIKTGATTDGSFSGVTAERVAVYQDARGLLVDGKVGPQTLNAMVPEQAGNGDPEHAIQLIVDLNNLDVTSDTLSVHFDAAVATDFQTTFESGNMRVIKVGGTAFTSGDALRDAIRDGLAVPAPEVEIEGPRPEHLSEAEEEAAVAANLAQFSDRRSRAAIQGAVGTDPDTIFGPDTVERIAEFQDAHGLTADGVVEESTLRVMVTELIASDGHNAAIRLIIDFFNLSEQGTLLDIAFDPAETDDNATTSGYLPGPSIVRIGQPGFDQGFEGLVHTIAHELEHVRQRREGIDDQHLREFLGEAVEILSVGMPEEGFAGFMDDAARAVANWEDVEPENEVANWERFEEVRDEVSARFDAASEADQTTHQATMDRYDAVTEPAAGP